MGNPQQVVDSYLTRLDFGNAAGAGGPASPAWALPDVRITDITLDGVGRPLDHTTTELGEQVALVRSGQSVRLRMGYETDQAVPTPVFALAIHTLDGTLAANPSTLATAMPEKVDGTGVVELRGAVADAGAGRVHAGRGDPRCRRRARHRHKCAVGALRGGGRRPRRGPRHRRPERTLGRFAARRFRFGWGPGAGPAR